ncbi:MAG: TrmH family RNA methyltransferase [Actinomycetota bacterium]
MDHPLIEDPSDPRLADYIGLSDRDINRRRENERFFIAEGPEVVRRLVASGLDIRSIVVSSNRVADMREALVATSAPVYLAERSVVSAVAGFDLHRGVIAAANRPSPTSLSDVLGLPAVAGSGHRIAILEGLNDHENLGAIARSARAFAIDALVLDERCADPYYRRTVRVSMGEILFLPIVRMPVESAMEVIRSAGGSSLALTPTADATAIGDLTIDHDAPLAFVLGAEGSGLTRTTLVAADHRVRIDIAPDVDSLNVGHAAAVAFALLRRRDS